MPVDEPRNRHLRPRLPLAGPFAHLHAFFGLYIVPNEIPRRDQTKKTPATSNHRKVAESTAKHQRPCQSDGSVVFYHGWILCHQLTRGEFLQIFAFSHLAENPSLAD